MNIIVMGTGPFAVPTFHWLLDSHHDILTLVTRPVINPGRRRKSPPNPMRDLAIENHISILDPPDVNAQEFLLELRQQAADLFVVCDYGQILSNQCLACSRLGGINLHGSLLPQYRGAAPINWAIYHGERTTGVTVIHMSPKLDAGPTLVQRELAIKPNETAEQLEPRLAELGVEAVAAAIDLLDQWDGVSPIGSAQDDSLASQAPRLTKQQGQIDWNQTASQIANQVRAFQPWPGSYTNLILDNDEPLRIIILRAVAVESDSPCQPGVIHSVDDSQMRVGTSCGLLEVSQVQPAGKRPMTTAEFLRGRRVQSGDKMGPASRQNAKKTQ